MIQICQKDKEKVYEVIRTGKIDAAEMSFPNLIDDIILTMKKRGLTDLHAQSGEDTPLELTRTVNTDVVEKGGDHQINDIVGTDIIQAGGDTVTITSVIEGKSITNIIHKLTNI